MWHVRERGIGHELKSLGESYWKGEMGRSGWGEISGGVSDMLSLKCLLRNTCWTLKVEMIGRHLEWTGDIHLGRL